MLTGLYRSCLGNVRSTHRIFHEVAGRACCGGNLLGRLEGQQESADDRQRRVQDYKHPDDSKEEAHLLRSFQFPKTLLQRIETFVLRIDVFHLLQNLFDGGEIPFFQMHNGNVVKRGHVFRIDRQSALIHRHGLVFLAGIP